MRHYRLLLRSTPVGYGLSTTAQRMLNRILTARYEPKQIATLLGYLCEEFYYNGASANLCDRWLTDTLRSVLGPRGIPTTEINRLAREYSVNIFK